MSASAWTGMVPIDDTALAVTDTGGGGRPLVYLNGSYADQRHWRPVMTELGGTDWRHISYDERARGRSKRSAGYSFEACLRDLGAVLDARDVERPILVGWSYGAAVGVHWAFRCPDRVSGVVSVDGALPYGLTDEEGRVRIRRLFHRMRWLFPIASRMGLAARMSAAEHAEINIEINEVTASIASILERVERPVRFVLATGRNLGGSEHEMEHARAALDPMLARNPNLQVIAKVPSNHSRIVRKQPAAIAQAVRQLAAESRHDQIG